MTDHLDPIHASASGAPALEAKPVGQLDGIGCHADKSSLKARAAEAGLGETLQRYETDY
ncbi:MAG: chlorophyllide reductase subunit Y, partial [Methylobacterium sp.]|nr:chlorophyllide reductase subunit Y [Methylobacterium sp.]